MKKAVRKTADNIVLIAMAAFTGQTVGVYAGQLAQKFVDASVNPEVVSVGLGNAAIAATVGAILLHHNKKTPDDTVTPQR